jgi:hypothetical protein
MMYCEPVDFGHRCMRWILKAIAAALRLALAAMLAEAAILFFLLFVILAASYRIGSAALGHRSFGAAWRSSSHSRDWRN